ncbi:MAG TPA: carbamoyltransferase HypF [Solirubrobacteraceae bacterium]|nr:carbamoyltransferase HypF [Solirubrobacteraceae bacterium]
MSARAQTARATARGASARQARRVRVRVVGTVQGVGFRPYVHRLARQLGLAGFVLNDARGVLAEVEGDAAGVETFLARLAPDAPPLAQVEHVLAEELQPTGELSFAIRPSPREGAVEAPVTPDAATCEDCVRELFDPGDRRYRYPFINCTNCGPRFTIVRGIPYDRPFTTMAGFRMCEQCAAEYGDPGNRRYHAQPNACSQCGPALTLLAPDGSGAPLGSAQDPLLAAAAALRAGRIVAIKGIGGYHLACRADSEEAVAKLRARKHREDRPFALMAGSPEQARALVRLGAGERALLCARERPIVLAPRRRGAAVAPSVAPGLRELGVMLPYSPVHHLLLAELGAPLVMTSGNVSDEPIAYRDDDARSRLGAIADLLLVGDRPIQTRTDDSVVRSLQRGGAPHTVFVRRSRGYVPAGIALHPPAARPLLACGAELKNTFCVARGARAWVSHHVGDLHNYETLRSFTEGIGHFEALFQVRPEVVAYDLHPEYLSTKYALERAGVRLIGVQHHHAHLAACLAEHGSVEPAVGAIFDGTGYGSDGTVWGGELLVGDLSGFRRAGMLLPVRLPGGERAIRQPWRMACAWLQAARDSGSGGQRDAAPLPVPASLRDAVDEQAWRQVGALCHSGLGSPLTTSMGRLFDAVGALCGLRAQVNYEAQAAIELEAACDPHERSAYPIAVRGGGELVVLDPRAAIAAVLADLRRGAATGVIASRFHNGVATATVRACAQLAAAHDLEQVVLSGGVFLNTRLLAAAAAGLTRAGLRVLVPERLPVGDGAISYGQAAVAAALTQGAGDA